MKILNNLAPTSHTKGYSKIGSKLLHKTIEKTIRGLDVVQQKIIETHEKNIEKQELESITCPLTGALNSVGLNKLLDNMVPSALNKMSLLAIDIDHFEVLSEQHGERVINKALPDFVREINNICRTTEIIARCNPGEFLLICPDTTLEQAANIAKKIRGAIQRVSWPKDMKLTCSLGVVKVNDESVYDLIKQIKLALNKGKLKAVNRIYLANKKASQTANEKVPKQVDSRNCALTGVLNRKGLSDLYATIAPQDLKKLSVVFIEINNFDDINFTYGNEVSDDVVQGFVAAVKNNSRTCDKIARWSTNEFLLVCPSTSIYHAQSIASEIRAAVNKSKWPQGVKVTCRTDVYDETCDDENSTTTNVA